MFTMLQCEKIVFCFFRRWFHLHVRKITGVKPSERGRSQLYEYV